MEPANTKTGYLSLLGVECGWLAREWSAGGGARGWLRVAGPGGDCGWLARGWLRVAGYLGVGSAGGNADGVLCPVSGE
jgi:hypothetical protein